MTSLRARPNTALLVIDVQNDVMANAYRRDEVISNIRDLVGRARADGVPVVWVQHANEQMAEGTDGWHYVPELARRPSEPIVHKSHGDAFEDTVLASVLARHGVGRLIVTGAQTDACIRATLHGAFARGYDTVLVGDAHTSEDFSEYGLPAVDKVIALTNMYWTWQTGPGRTATVVEAAAVEFRTDVGYPSDLDARAAQTRETAMETLSDPLARDLLHSRLLARLGYDGLDGAPRVVPVGFVWDGSKFVVCTAVKAPKVRALDSNPKVALSIDTDTQPPRALLVRGTATVDIVDGVPDEFLEATAKSLPREQWSQFEAQARAIYPQMARITIEPEWAKLLDFETRLPVAVEGLVADNS